MAWSDNSIWHALLVGQLIRVEGDCNFIFLGNLLHVWTKVGGDFTEEMSKDRHIPHTHNWTL